MTRWSFVPAIAVLLLACGGGEDRSAAPQAPEPAAPAPATPSAPPEAAAPTPQAPAPAPEAAAAPGAEGAPAAPAGEAGAMECTVTGPRGGMPVDDPTGALRGDAACGAKLYALYCASCHGQGGKGDGPAAPKNPPPADHTDPGRMGALSDEEIYKVINKGGAAVGKSPLMAAWGPIVGDQGVRDLVAFVRSLSGT
jgi:mono/diheme cytochrome c family protein